MEDTSRTPEMPTRMPCIFMDLSGHSLSILAIAASTRLLQFEEEVPAQKKGAFL
jgi:hypothetical protein